MSLLSYPNCFLTLFFLLPSSRISPRRSKWRMDWLILSELFIVLRWIFSTPNKRRWKFQSKPGSRVIIDGMWKEVELGGVQSNYQIMIPHGPLGGLWALFMKSLLFLLLLLHLHLHLLLLLLLLLLPLLLLPSLLPPLWGVEYVKSVDFLDTTWKHVQRGHLCPHLLHEIKINFSLCLSFFKNIIVFFFKTRKKSKTYIGSMGVYAISGVSQKSKHLNFQLFLAPQPPTILRLCPKG